MAEFSRPTTFEGKLQLVQRLVRAAQFRSDPKIAVREVAEAVNELVNALLERDQGQPAGQAKPPPQ